MNRQLEEMKSILEGAFGPVLWVPGDRVDLAPAIAAAASAVNLVGNPLQLKATSDELERLGLPSPQIIGSAEELAQDSAELVGATIINAAPFPGESLEWLESALARTAHEGFVQINASSGLGPKGRLSRLLEASTQSMCAPSWSVASARCWVARRDAFGAELELDALECADAAAILPCSAADVPGGLEIVCADLLFRQEVPPSVLLILDSTPEGEEGIPEDLWGMAAHSATQPAIMRVNDEGGEGLEAAMEAVDASWIWIADPRMRPAPALVRVVDAVLDARPSLQNLAAARIRMNSEGQACAMDEEGQGTLTFRNNSSSRTEKSPDALIPLPLVWG